MKDLSLYAYKVLPTKDLMATDHDKRRESVEWIMKKQLLADFSNKIMMALLLKTVISCGAQKNHKWLMRRDKRIHNVSLFRANFGLENHIAYADDLGGDSVFWHLQPTTRKFKLHRETVERISLKTRDLLSLKA